MSATEDPEDLESIEEHRGTLKLVFDYLSLNPPSG